MVVRTKAMGAIDKRGIYLKYHFFPILGLTKSFSSYCRKLVFLVKMYEKIRKCFPRHS